MRIAFSSNSSWSIYNFRSNLLQALVANNHEIYIVAPPGNYLELLKESGYQTIPININNSSKGISSNIKLLADLFKIYKSIRPDVVLHNAVKPNIYGALVCRILRIPVINNISGLGAIFMSNGISSILGKILYRISQKRVNTVFLQNSTDYNLFITNKIISQSQARLLPGSGVDLIRFSPIIKQATGNKIKFCFVGRLLGDKGIYEYIYASKKIKTEFPNTVFYILGELYLQHPTAISEETLKGWVSDGTIIYMGKTDHVEKELGQFDCIVLPSYREGLSRVLLEACSMAIPAITTNVPGCIDVIEHEKNGLICKVKDSDDLYQQMKKFIGLSVEDREKMGVYGRSKIEKQFDEKIVIEHYLKAIENIKIS